MLGALRRSSPRSPRTIWTRCSAAASGSPVFLLRRISSSRSALGIVQKQVQAAALERGGQVAGVIRGEDDARRMPGHERAYLWHRYLILGEHFEQDRLQGLVRAVHLVDQEHHGIGRTDGFEQRTRGEEALGEEGALLLRDPLDRGMQIGGVAEQLADLLPQDLGVQELLAVIPLVQSLGVVLALIALQPQQPPPGRRGDGLGQLGLADSGGPLDQQGLVELGLDEYRRGQLPVGDVPVAGQRAGDVIDGLEVRHSFSR